MQGAHATHIELIEYCVASASTHGGWRRRPYLQGPNLARLRRPATSLQEVAEAQVRLAWTKNAQRLSALWEDVKHWNVNEDRSD